MGHRGTESLAGYNIGKSQIYICMNFYVFYVTHCSKYLKKFAGEEFTETYRYQHLNIMYISLLELFDLEKWQQKLKCIYLRMCVWICLYVYCSSIISSLQITSFLLSLLPSFSTSPCLPAYSSSFFRHGLHKHSICG